MMDQQKINGRLLIPAYRHIYNDQLITRLEGKKNYTLVHLTSKANPLLVSRTLKFFELQLTDFIRVNKSLLINPVYVDKVIKVSAKRMVLQLAGGITVAVSRRRIASTWARLKS